jgi:hypothetical protein
MAERRKKNNLKIQRVSMTQRRTKEIYWILGVMVLCVLLFVGVYQLFKGVNSFDYKGMHFTKEMFGQIPVYHYYYVFNITNGKQTQLVKYNLFLRNDPRKNEVPIEGEIAFSKDVVNYISVDGFGFEECPQANLAVAGLASFLTNNMLKVKGATPRLIQAQASNVTYATCETNPNDVVILIKAANETKITKQNNCYQIDVANCEILPATEKFEVQSILDAKARQKAEGK